MNLSRTVRRRWPLAGLLAVLLAATPAAPAAPASAAADPPPTVSAGDPAPASHPAPQVVTLITGDRVEVRHTPDGRVAVTVDPAPRAGQQPRFETVSDPHRVYVIPSDAAPLVPEVLDRELFNVTKLAEYGYTDGIPVITVHRGPAGVRATAGDGPTAGEGATVTRTLESIDAAAATIAPDGRWWQAVSTAPPAPTDDATGAAAIDAGVASTGGALAGVAKVWLDEQVEAALDQSVPMVGAPAAWDAGYDGTGLTVAVLDTGIDADHPDLAGKVVAARNFAEGSTTADDLHGHGTHVAGIVAGTGAASGGTYRGVAPGVELINAKVLGDLGVGFESDIIAGMEWAVTNGADIVNLSLGGGQSDGTDPVSQALNTLSAEHDVLFVVAAGNEGFLGDGSINAPGAADAALTVGSVDKSGQLAFDSGRGPRRGDYAIKPDLTAPGVGIAAARADGTALGPVVDEHYTRISGTSMATPHVTGAAAILRQQHPDLSAPELKAALATTATPHPGLDVYQQGAGRLDVAAAVSAQVTASPSPLDLGYLRYPHEGEESVTAEVTFTNRRDASLTLALAVSARSRDGDAVPADVLTVTPSTVTVAPGGTATATVTLDRARARSGLYGGYLVATHDGATVSRIPVGYYHEAESYDLTVVGTARDGRPAGGISNVDVLSVTDMRAFAADQVRFTDGKATLRVPPGTYSVTGAIYTYDAAHVFTQEQVLVGDPQVEVTADTTVVLDARHAVPVTVETPAHDSAPLGVTSLSVYRADRTGFGHIHDYVGPPQPQFAVPTQPVTKGEFEFVSFWQMGAPQLALSVVEPQRRDLSPALMTGSPPVDGDVRLPLVYAGLGHLEDYQGVDAAGAAVLVQRGEIPFAAKEANARAAGARVLIVANNAPGSFVGDVGGGAGIPTLALSQEEGDDLRSLLSGGEVTVWLRGTLVTPFRYDLVLPEPDRIPDDLRYVVGPDDLATVVNHVHSDVPRQVMNELRHYWRPYTPFAVGFALPMPAPMDRTEYVVASDTRYRQHVYAAVPFTGSMMEPVAVYEPGQRVERSWWRQVTRPGVVPGVPAVRTGDTLSLRIAEWADAGPGHWGEMHPEVDTTTFRIYRDGQLVAEQERPWGTFAMPAAPADYRLELDVDRSAPWWTTSTSTRTAWTFRSQRPDAGPQALPLLMVDYEADVDRFNAARHPRERRGAPTLDLHVGHQPGAQPAPVAQVRVWVSNDDGATWVARSVNVLADGHYRVTVPVWGSHHGTGYVSLRVEAADVDGNRVEQIVTRAWRSPAG